MSPKKPKEIRVNDVITAAVGEFIERGFEGASMESIARRAGLTKGGLYHHFSSKDDILLAANELFTQPVMEMVQRAEENPSAAQGLSGFFREYLEHFKARPGELTVVALTLAKAMQAPSRWPVMAAYAEAMIAFYRRMLERAQAAGEIARCDADARATALLGAVDGLAAYVLMAERLTPHKVAADLSRAFLEQPGGGA